VKKKGSRRGAVQAYRTKNADVWRAVLINAILSKLMGGIFHSFYRKVVPNFLSFSALAIYNVQYSTAQYKTFYKDR